MIFANLMDRAILSGCFIYIIQTGDYIFPVGHQKATQGFF